MENWIRKGLIYKTESDQNWNKTHCQVPTPFQIDENTLRLFYSTRDVNNRSSITFIDVSKKDVSKILNVSKNPVLNIGEIGMHDESGVMPSCFIKKDNEIYMYYTGWNIGGNVSYRTSIGLAISKDNGNTFIRHSNGPIIDRSIYDPCFACQPHVIFEQGKWRMWYLSCTKWEIINNHPEPFYHVKYAFSENGINWVANGQISLDYNDEIDAVGNPSVLKVNNEFKMYFSFRKAKNYRTSSRAGYKLGVATSKDGIKFHFQKNSIKLLGKTENWEKEMNAYPHVININGEYIMFYNGNGFGKSGFGYAKLK
tara:strand:+ start:2421 stop:3353 length:933 start_codon:yes stop_codon:yes gene_type:complete